MARKTEWISVKNDPKLEAWIKKQNDKKAADLTKARLFYSDGRVETYEDQSMAYSIWLGHRKGVRLAFRGKGDATPVYSHDYVDRG